MGRYKYIYIEEWVSTLSRNRILIFYWRSDSRRIKTPITIYQEVIGVKDHLFKRVVTYR